MYQELFVPGLTSRAVCLPAAEDVWGTQQKLRGLQSRAVAQRASCAPPRPARPSMAAGLGSGTGAPQLLARPALLILGYRDAPVRQALPEVVQ